MYSYHVAILLQSVPNWRKAAEFPAKLFAQMSDSFFLKDS